jgi:hypothetical protein
VEGRCEPRVVALDCLKRASRQRARKRIALGDYGSAAE